MRSRRQESRRAPRHFTTSGRDAWTDRAIEEAESLAQSLEFELGTSSGVSRHDHEADSDDDDELNDDERALRALQRLRTRRTRHELNARNDRTRFGIHSERVQRESREVAQRAYEVRAALQASSERRRREIEEAGRTGQPTGRPYETRRDMRRRGSHEEPTLPQTTYTMFPAGSRATSPALASSTRGTRGSTSSIQSQRQYYPGNLDLPQGSSRMGAQASGPQPVARRGHSSRDSSHSASMTWSEEEEDSASEEEEDEGGYGYSQWDD